MLQIIPQNFTLHQGGANRELRVGKCQFRGCGRQFQSIQPKRKYCDAHNSPEKRYVRKRKQK